MHPCVRGFGTDMNLDKELLDSIDWILIVTTLCFLITMKTFVDSAVRNRSQEGQYKRNR